MSAEKGGRRRDIRQPHPCVIEYSVTPASNENLKGVSLNISNSGLAIYIFRHLMQDQEIHIKSFIPVDYRRRLCAG